MAGDNLNFQISLEEANETWYFELQSCINIQRQVKIILIINAVKNNN